jgi:probable HAF family extracellular repeat protein
MTPIARLPRVRIALITLLLAALSASASQYRYAITKLGIEDFSEAFAINDRGEVTLRTAVQSTQSQTAAVYFNQTLKLVPNLPGSNAIFPSALNQIGHVAGTSFFPAGQGARGFFYDQTSTRDLGILSGGTSTAIHGINDTDALAGSIEFPTSARAFVKVGTVVTELNGLGGQRTAATDINNFGQVIGYSSLAGSDGTLHGFLYSAGTTTDLFVATGGVISHPLAINDAGVIVGRSATNTPFKYKNGITSILNAGVGFSAANAINDYNEVVGSTQISIDSSRAFYQTDGQIVIDLNHMVALSDGVAPGFTSLETAVGINNRGWIVGQGYYWDGAKLSLQAYLLVPQIPAFAPTFTGPPGSFSSVWAVSLETSTPGAVIRYTTDGSIPTALKGALYKGFFVISQTTTVKAVAFGSGYAESAVSSQVYTYIPPPQRLDSFTLLNADTGLPIPGLFETLVNGMVIDLGKLPTRRIAIRANTIPETVGSVRFAFSGNANFRTESEKPYALWADKSGTYTPATPAPGDYTLTGTPYTGAGATGTAGMALTVRFTVTDADTVRPSTPTGLFAVTLLPTEVTLRWNPSSDNVGVTGYEVIQNGISKGVAERTIRTLTGLTPNTSYVLAVRARDAAGNWSDTASLFNVTTPATILSVDGVSLIDVDTGLPIAGYNPIANGAVISRASLPTTRLNLLVRTNPMVVGSVKLKLDSTTKTESLAPYAYFGDVNGKLNAGSISNGTHTFTATPYSGGSATGTAGTPLTITFTIQ